MSRVEVMVDAGFPVRQAHAITGVIAATVSAAGSNQSDATALTADNNLITTATEDQGVVLPAFAAGSIWVVNGTSVTVFCYPPTGATFNNAPANAPLLMPPQCGAIIKAISSTQYLVVHC